MNVDEAKRALRERDAELFVELERAQRTAIAQQYLIRLVDTAEGQARDNYLDALRRSSIGRFADRIVRIADDVRRAQRPISRPRVISPEPRTSPPEPRVAIQPQTDNATMRLARATARLQRATNATARARQVLLLIERALERACGMRRAAEFYRRLPEAAAVTRRVESLDRVVSASDSDVDAIDAQLQAFLAASARFYAAARRECTDDAPALDWVRRAERLLARITSNSATTNADANVDDFAEIAHDDRRVRALLDEDDARSPAPARAMFADGTFGSLASLANSLAARRALYVRDTASLSARSRRSQSIETIAIDDTLGAENVENDKDADAENEKEGKEEDKSKEEVGDANERVSTGAAVDRATVLNRTWVRLLTLRTTLVSIALRAGVAFATVARALPSASLALVVAAGLGSFDTLAGFLVASAVIARALGVIDDRARSKVRTTLELVAMYSVIVALPAASRAFIETAVFTDDAPLALALPRAASEASAALVARTELYVDNSLADSARTFLGAIDTSAVPPYVEPTTVAAVMSVAAEVGTSPAFVWNRFERTWIDSTTRMPRVDRIDAFIAMQQTLALRLGTDQGEGIDDPDRNGGADRDGQALVSLRARAPEPPLVVVLALPPDALRVPLLQRQYDAAMLDARYVPTVAGALHVARRDAAERYGAAAYEMYVDTGAKALVDAATANPLLAFALIGGGAYVVPALAGGAAAGVAYGSLSAVYGTSSVAYGTLLALPGVASTAITSGWGVVGATAATIKGIAALQSSGAAVAGMFALVSLATNAHNETLVAAATEASGATAPALLAIRAELRRTTSSRAL